MYLQLLYFFLTFLEIDFSIVHLYFSADKSLTYDDSDEFLLIILRPVKFYAHSAYKLVGHIFHFHS